MLGQIFIKTPPPNNVLHIELWFLQLLTSKTDLKTPWTIPNLTLDIKKLCLVILVADAGNFPIWEEKISKTSSKSVQFECAGGFGGQFKVGMCKGSLAELVDFEKITPHHLPTGDVFEGSSLSPRIFL